jgi:hypothetical protein
MTNPEADTPSVLVDLEMAGGTPDAASIGIITTRRGERIITNDDLDVPSTGETISLDIATYAVDANVPLVKSKRNGTHGVRISDREGPELIVFESGDYALVVDKYPWLDRRATIVGGFATLATAALLTAGTLLEGSSSVSESIEESQTTKKPPAAEVVLSPKEEEELSNPEIPEDISFAFSPKDDKVPLWGDGLPDVELDAEKESFHAELESDTNFNSHLAFDCTVLPTTVEAELGDTIVGIGQERYPGQLRRTYARAHLDWVNTELNIQKGVIDSREDFIYPGDDIYSVEDCYVTDHWGVGVDRSGTGHLGAHWIIQQNLAHTWGVSDVQWRWNGETFERTDLPS